MLFDRFKTGKFCFIRIPFIYFDGCFLRKLSTKANFLNKMKLLFETALRKSKETFRNRFTYYFISLVSDHIFTFSAKLLLTLIKINMTMKLKALLWIKSSGLFSLELFMVHLKSIET